MGESPWKFESSRPHHYNELTNCNKIAFLLTENFYPPLYPPRELRLRGVFVSPTMSPSEQDFPSQTPRTSAHDYTGGIIECSGCQLGRASRVSIMSDGCLLLAGVGRARFNDFPPVLSQDPASIHSVFGVFIILMEHLHHEHLIVRAPNNGLPARRDGCS